MKAFIEKFEKGTHYVKVLSPVKDQELTVIHTGNDDYKALKCLKFIPASGAATRMFKDLYTYLEEEKETKAIDQFFENLADFPFYEELATHLGSIDSVTVEGRLKVVDCLLNQGMSYGSLPKALLSFHQYDSTIAKPIDEHIYEGEQYLNEERVNLHFTISKEHEDLFNAYVAEVIEGKDNLAITYSFQKKSTDTLAVDMNNKPFQLDNGEVLYRAGGHGALIENLNDLDGDIIFVKNIDNVCHQTKAAITIESKKKLASVGYQVKKILDGHLEDLAKGQANMDDIGTFLKETLNIQIKGDLTRDLAYKLLNRPLRVCGMVKNQGEPGGGPFIVDNGGYTDLQICEKAELDLNDQGVKAILADSGYFNPVDLVCFTKDYQGQKFNLLDFINEDRYFISEKSYKGRKLKALEHPGLWNGAMHHWNTLFVEVPLMTFNPVKTVNDLLREGHVK